MHRDVGATFFERRLQLLDEQPLAADGGQASILNAVALGGDRHEFDLETGMGLTQETGYVLGLPQGELTLSSGNSKRRFRMAHF
jgi:hypothetical protein